MENPSSNFSSQNSASEGTSSETTKIYCELGMHELQIIQWRNKIDLNIFKVFNLSEQIIKQGKIYLIQYEKEDILFKDMHRLTIEEVLYFFKSILLMLNKLVLKFGLFLLTDKMIGFSQRKCKIWINEVFTSNQVMLTAKNQKEMIQNILTILSKNTQNTNLTAQFYTKAKQNCISISQSQQFLLKFCFDKSIYIPPEINNRKRKGCLKTGKQKKQKLLSIYKESSNFKIHSENQYISAKEKKKKLKSVFFQQCLDSTQSEFFTISQTLNLSVKPRNLLNILPCQKTIKMRNIRKMKEIISLKIHGMTDIHVENKNIMNTKPDIYTTKSLYDSSLNCSYETEEEKQNSQPLKISQLGRMSESIHLIESKEDHIVETDDFNY